MCIRDSLNVEEDRISSDEALQPDISCDHGQVTQGLPREGSQGSVPVNRGQWVPLGDHAARPIRCRTKGPAELTRSRIRYGKEWLDGTLVRGRGGERASESTREARHGANTLFTIAPMARAAAWVWAL